MRAALQSRFLWLLVSDAELCPSKPPDVKLSNIPAAEWKAEKKEYLYWLLRDQAAQGLMKGAVESLQWPHVPKADTTKEMWDTWQIITVNNKKYSNPEYWGKIPRIFILIQKYSKIEYVQKLFLILCQRSGENTLNFLNQILV